MAAPLLLTPFYYNCHPTPERATASIQATQDSSDQAVHTMSESSLPPTAPDGANLSDGKVRLSGSALGLTVASNQKLSNDAMVPESASLLALYDNDCRGLERPLRFEAEALSLNRDTSMSELESMASADPCLIRIDENRTLSLIDPPPTTTSAVSPSDVSNSVSALATTNDPLIDQARQLAFTKALSSWDWFYSGVGIDRDVLVAVVDTGVLYTHPDLVNNIYTDANGNHGFNFVANTSDPLDDNGHGTHVSGLIAAQSNNGMGMSGIMGSRAKIIAVKALNNQGSGTEAQIVNGLRYAADSGAQVLNMSLGGAFVSTAIRDAMAYAATKGVVVIVAAGNDNVQLSPTVIYSPASYSKDIPGCLTVGSVDTSSGARSGFSNFSPTYVWIAAPGSTGILSTYLNNGYMNLQGTSMASPVTAGAAALLVGAFRSRGITYAPVDVVNLLTESSRTNAALATSFRDGATLDLERAAKLFYTRYVLSGDAGLDL